MLFGSILFSLPSWVFHIFLVMLHSKLSYPLIQLQQVFLTLYPFGYELQWQENAFKKGPFIYIFSPFRVASLHVHGFYLHLFYSFYLL